MFFLLPLLPAIAAATTASSTGIATGILAGAAIGATAKTLHDKYEDDEIHEARSRHLAEKAESLKAEREESVANIEKFVMEKRSAMSKELKEVDELLEALKKEKP